MLIIRFTPMSSWNERYLFYPKIAGNRNKINTLILFNHKENSMKHLIINAFCVLGLLFSLVPQPVIAAIMPPEPDYVPPELVVTPGSQNIGTPPSGRAGWWVTLEGGSGGYTVTVTWGDSCSPYTSSGWYSGTTRWIVHDFNCGYSTIYYQTWKAQGFSGPVYEYTTVLRY